MNPDVCTLYLRFLMHLTPATHEVFTFMHSRWDEWKARFENDPCNRGRPNPFDSHKPSVERDFMQVTSWALNGWIDTLGNVITADRLLRLSEWFMERYSLNNALPFITLAKRKRDGNTDDKEMKPVSWGLLIPLLLLLCGMSWVPIGFGSSSWPGGFSGILVYTLILCTVMLLSGVLRFRGGFLILLMPRQFGALFVGYLLVLISGDFLTFLLYLAESWQWLLWLILCPVAGFAYVSCVTWTRLFTTVGAKEVIWRSFSVILAGITESLLLGGGLFGLFGPFLNGIFPDHSTCPLPVDWRTPLCGQELAFLFTAAATALLFGVFLQIFWDEHPLTDPL